MSSPSHISCIPYPYPSPITHPIPSFPSSKHHYTDNANGTRPQIPDAVTSYYLTKAGIPPAPTTDPRLARLLALATQKFIADIAADAYQYSRIRSSNSTSQNPMGNLVGASGIPGAPVMAGQEQSRGRGNLGIQRPGFGGGGGGGGQGRTVLSMEDLGMAVGEYGVNVKRGEFYR